MLLPFSPRVVKICDSIGASVMRRIKRRYSRKPKTNRIIAVSGSVH